MITSGAQDLVRCVSTGWLPQGGENAPEIRLRNPTRPGFIPQSSLDSRVSGEQENKSGKNQEGENWIVMIIREVQASRATLPVCPEAGIQGLSSAVGDE